MTPTSALHLSPIKRASGPSQSPAPISWPPSQYWDGDDGSWSSFDLRVGNPEQIVRVLISSASEATWLVLPGGCPPDTQGITPALTCSESRGEIFDPSLSKNWTGLGNYSLGVETNLGYDVPGEYGLDTVALGLTNGTGEPSLQGQVVAGLETYDYYTGLFGLGDQPVNLTASTDSENLTGTIPHPSFLTTMKNHKLIPSRSWAYTAGASYRLPEFNNVFGSLTFGGYDSSRLIRNNVTFDFAPDISRDLVVSLQSITSTATNGSTVSLLPNSIQIFIDSTFPYIYLPLDSCQAFEKAFNLTWNATEGFYFVDDTLHQSLTALNASITFQIANSQIGGPTVDIVLPYASFDLLASYPMVVNSTRYFPLQRAANESQYTLGRTFFQEAYLIANYEYSNFSVSQAKFEDGLPENLVALPSADLSPTSKSHSRMNRKSIIGLSFGLTVFVILIALLVYLTRKKLRKHSQKNNISKNAESPRLSQDIKPANISALHEIGNSGSYLPGELPDSGKVELLDGSSPSGSGNEISEMPQSPTPVPLCELGTRHTSIATSTLNRQSERNRYAIVVQTGILRESSDSSEAQKESPRVETVISSSPRHKSLNLDRPLPTPPEKTADYLNRALPSIPSSDSTQISPTKTSSSSLSSRTSVADSDPEIAPPDTSLDMIWEDYDMSWESPRRQEPSLLSLSSKNIQIMIVPEVAERQMREHPSLSSLSTDVEIVVPPGTPKSQIPSSPNSREGERTTHQNFF